ncbi:BatD family protein [Thiocapsa bogorovii]|uniref:BatD family protein n=1 Tax=Thiocapsa bogorovii TaxID=521689 RepID=UPI001E2F460F|nr:BatD family protein [Thiocapsa bogorovii]UHD14935.1 BatD family protein [Thiocapsa bogorovii]
MDDLIRLDPTCSRGARRTTGKRSRRPLHAVLLPMLCAITVFAASVCVGLMVVTPALAQGALLDGVSAEIDRDRIAANETLILQLFGDGRLSGEPELQVLEEDFDILSRSQSERMSVLNGSVSHTREWRIELAPKRTGRLEIPALAWGDARSEPITVDVVEDAAADDPSTGPKPIFVRTETDEQTPYVQQAFHYRVQVLYREREAPQRAVLSDPQVEGATIERDGEDRASVEVIDGQRYQVIERRFLVVPLQSGPLVIRGPRLEAVMPAPRPAGRSAADEFDALFGAGPFAGLSRMTTSGRRIVERSPDLEIQVRAQPPGSSSPWLPAESVEISDEWIPSSPRFQVGEPVTRVLTATARGATAAQLPPLALDPPDGAQIYPGQTRAEDLPGVGAPVGIRSIEVALVPTRAGRVTLPEVRVPWWDTREDRERVAIVPARTLEVAEAPAGAAGGGKTQPSEVSGEPESEDAAAVPDRVDEAAEPRESGTGPSAAEDWVRRAIAGPIGLGVSAFGLIGLGWLAALGWLKRGSRRREDADRVETRASPQALREARRRVEQACLNNDARSARTALLDWGRVRWGGEAPAGLGALALRLDDAAAAETLAQLDRALYAGTGGAAAGPAGAAWDGIGAWQILKPRLSGDGADAASDRSADLPELYPRRI